MTEFRSKGKGKERKVYPVKKRQPYGISRELAYKDVQALREKGKKARLIETNKRLVLYAPYESDLPTPVPVLPEPTKEIPENNPVPEYKPEQKKTTEEQYIPLENPLTPSARRLAEIEEEKKVKEAWERELKEKRAKLGLTYDPKLKMFEATHYYDHRRAKNWVAKLTGLDPKYKFNRDFVRGSNMDGDHYYNLSDGIYQVENTYYSGRGAPSPRESNGYYEVRGDSIKQISEREAYLKLKKKEIRVVFSNQLIIDFAIVMV